MLLLSSFSIMPFTFAQNNASNQPPFPIKPTISITKPDKIKIISIGMFPNPLKKGDQPQFTVTYKNISEKPLYHAIMGCNATPPLIWEISPSYNVQEQTSPGFNLSRCSSYWQHLPYADPEHWKTLVKMVKPNETSIARGSGIHAETYTVTKDGELHVTLKLDLADGTISGLQSTIRFNVNTTQ
jgi:hypothetical protein